MPSHTVSGDQSGGGLLEDVAEVHDPPAGVGHLDADRGLARDRGEDSDVGRRQRVGEVVLEPGDLRDLDPRRQPELVAGDVGTGHAPDHLRLDPEVAERLEQSLGNLFLAGRVGLGGLAGRPHEKARPRHPPDEIGIVGDRGSVAPLRGEIFRADGPARRSFAVLIVGVVRGTVAFAILILERQLLLVGGVDRRRLDMGGTDDQFVGLRLLNERLICEIPAGALVGIDAPRRMGGGSDRRGRACQIAAGAAQRHGRGGGVAAGTADRRSERGSREQDHPRQQHEHSQDVRAGGREQMRGDPEVALADDSAALLERRRMPVLLRRRGPWADPERSGRERQRQRERHAQGPGSQRTDRRSPVPREDQRPGQHQRGRHHIADGAEQEPRRPHGSVAERASTPMQVGDAAEEDPDRDQRQREHVDLVGLELQRAAQRRPAGQQRALRAGRRGLPAFGLGTCRGHVRGTRFDAGEPIPPITGG